MSQKIYCATLLYTLDLYPLYKKTKENTHGEYCRILLRNHATPTRGLFFDSDQIFSRKFANLPRFLFNIGFIEHLPKLP